ncbi:MAG: flavodoxin [Gordonibacter sp.]|uniref:flavodoxin n=1 Tax=Gordonibacter sp. TaxID=1968902 RepID=UPI002FC95DBB
MPPLAATVENWESYDVVYLGAPVWWNQLPHVMRSFLAQHDLSGKTASPFCTSGGSSIAGMADALRATPRANLLEGLAIGSSLPGALDHVRP